MLVHWRDNWQMGSPVQQHKARALLHQCTMQMAQLPLVQALLKRSLQSSACHGSAPFLARLLGLTNSEVYKHGGDALEIRIKADKDSHTVIIE